MPKLVLTVIGDDRAGLVEALSTVVASHGGNWEESQLAELAGTFAGVVVVSAAKEKVDGLVEALDKLDGLLKIEVRAGREVATATGDAEGQRLQIEVVGNDHAGIVHEISAALAGNDISIERMTTRTVEAPMAGGLLFEATIEAVLGASADPAKVRADLERVASELLVDLTLQA